MDTHYVPPVDAPSQLETDLRVVRGYIERGWAQNMLFASPGGDIIDHDEGLRYPNRVKRVCASGAIQLGVRGRNQEQRRLAVAGALLYEIGRTIPLPTDGGAHTIPGYNDRSDTTQEKVLALIDRAIEHERANVPLPPVAMRRMDPVHILAMANPPHDPEYTDLDVLVPPVVGALT